MKNLLTKFFYAVMVVSIFISMLAVPAMAEPEIKVVLNGVELTFDVPPQLINDRTMVPMRKIFEALDAEVDWEENTQTITAVKGETIILMQIDNPVMTVDGIRITLDVPPQMINDRTLVPVRAVSEGLQAAVDWDEATQTVLINLTNSAPSPVNTPSPTPSATPLPTIKPSSSSLPSSEAKYYEANSSIPDYGSVTGKERVKEWEPENMSRVWQFVYQYNENDLKKYTDFAEKLGFKKVNKNEPFYYSNGIEGFYIINDIEDGYTFIMVYDEGTAEKAITLKNEKFYLENTAVPNCGNFMQADPIRFEAGYTAAGTEIVIYVYPLPDIYSIAYNRKLQDDGWILGGGVSDGPVSKFSYLKNDTMMAVVTDKVLKTITISFNVTNQSYSKPPAEQ